MVPPAPSANPVSVARDTASLKVLAHPLRNRLVTRLRALGRATATDLARDLGTNTGATSYHLRKLAEVGLVEDTGDGEGKRRLWQPASGVRSWVTADVAGDEDAETALNWLERDYLRHLQEKANRWLDLETDWPVAWRDALATRDDHVVATAEQVAAMHAEIAEVIKRYQRVGQGNPTARRVSIWSVCYPIDLDTPPRRPDR